MIEKKIASPARIKAFRYIKESIEKSLDGGCSILPSYKKMANESGVAPKTMLRVLRVLERGGILYLEHGRATRLTGKIPPDIQAVQPSKSAYEKEPTLAQRIHTDILAGRYPQGTMLPSYKVLSRIYGSSYPTLKIACSTLAKTRILLPHKNGYLVPLVQKGLFRTTIVLILRGFNSRTPLFANQRSMDHIRALQSECDRLSLRLRLLPFYYIGEELTGIRSLTTLLAQRSVADSILGFIVWEMVLPENNLHEILSHLVSAVKPVCLFDESNLLAIPSAIRQSHQFRHFAIATSVQCGRDMGNLILNKGHRKIAYFKAPLTRSPDMRLKGIQEVFASAGLHDGVLVFEANKNISKSFTRIDTEPIYDYNRKLLDQQETLKNNVFSAWERVQSTMLQFIDYSEKRQHSREMLLPLFERAISNRSITAWVCYNDELAVESLDFLESSGKTVPGDIAITGFDDSHDALCNQLTSFNFNGAACMHAMVSFIVNPRSVPPSAVPIEFDGYINERLST